MEKQTDLHCRTNQSQKSVAPATSASKECCYRKNDWFKDPTLFPDDYPFYSKERVSSLEGKHRVFRVGVSSTTGVIDL